MVQQGSPRPKENSKKNREQKWIKYRQQHQWTAFKRERNRYNQMIKFCKRHSIFTKIKDNHNNPRHLYKIISSLIGQDNTNPLPDAQSDQELAEQFAEFFLQKIETIQEKFNNIALHMTEPNDIPQITKFSPISEPDLCKIIKAMPSKSCELDYMGTDKIKEVLHTCIPSISKIVNLSLEKGAFSNQWKTAIVKPLIKAKKGHGIHKLQTSKQSVLHIQGGRKMHTTTTHTTLQQP